MRRNITRGDHIVKIPLLFTAMILFYGLAQAQVRTLDNGVLVVGVNMIHGGAINELREVGSGINLVNTYDLGRYIQQSYYSGPVPFDPPGSVSHPAYPNWGWNPVQAGNSFGQSSTLLASSNDGVTLYVKCKPKQWALNSLDAECTMESWIRLDANRVHVRNRLVNLRTETTPGISLHQELPALYTIGTLFRLFTYTGNAPFSGDSLTQINNSGPPWTYWQSTENWSALVDDADWGLGIYHPGANLTIGGFSGVPNLGGSSDANTGYIAPLHQDVIDNDIVYEFEYTLIVGDLQDDIRSYVYSQAAPSVPNYQFRNNRQHFYSVNLSDPSPPFANYWPLNLDQADPQLIGPLGHWSAVDAPALRFTAAFRTESNLAELFFAKDGGSFSAQQRLTFSIIPDGVVRTYIIDLSAHPLYVGNITQLRLDPLISATNGDEVDLYSLTTVTPAAITERLAATRPFRLQTNFPNPFNPRTTIRFETYRSAPVSLVVYDTRGRVVRTLLSFQVMTAGRHEVIWGGEHDNGARAASGAYFYRLTTPNATQTMKMSLIK